MKHALPTNRRSPPPPPRRPPRRAILLLASLAAAVLAVIGLSAPNGGRARSADSAATANADAETQTLRRLLDENPDDPDALLRLVEILFRRGDAEEAAPFFSRLLTLRADDPAALFELGRMAWNHERGAEAASALLAALDAQPGPSRSDAAAARTILDRIYEAGDAVEVMRRREDHDLEERFLSSRLERHPEDAVALALRGLARRSQYRFEDALGDLVAAQKIGLPDLEFRGVVQRARIDLERFAAEAELSGHDAAEEFRYSDVRERLQALDRAGDWNGMERYLAELTLREPVRAHAAVQRAYLRIARGDLAGAEEDFAEALRTEPDEDNREDVERGRRLIAELLRPGSEADAYLPESGLAAIASNPSFMVKVPTAPWYRSAAKLQLAESLTRDHVFRAAEVVLGKLRKMPLSAVETARFQACAADVLWAEGKFDEAAALFRAALESPLGETRRAGLFHRLALYHLEKGEREQAFDYARQSIALTDRLYWTHIRIGRFFIDAGELEEGFAHLDRALELCRTADARFAVHEAVMKVHKALGNDEKFVETAEKYVAEARRIETPLPPALEGMADYYQAEIHRIRGEEDRAYLFYERASRSVASPELRADLLMTLAEMDAERGDVGAAAAHAERAAAIFPDRPAKRREAAAFLQRLGLGGAIGEAAEDQARLDLENALDEAARAADAAESDGDRDAYLRHAEQYVETADNADQALTPAETGLAEFFRAGIAGAAGDDDRAYAAYERAADSLTEAKRLGRLFLEMAKIDAKRGRFDLAARHAGRSAELEPENRPRYLEYAARRAEEILREGDAAGEEDKGLAAYYSAELRAEEGGLEAAADDYRRAAALLADRRLLAKTFMKLAEIHLQAGEEEPAIRHAERSAEAWPDDAENLLRVGKFLLGLDLPDEALPYFRRWLEATPVVDRDPEELFPLAEAFQRRGETNKAFSVVRMVMQTERVDVSSENPEGLLAFYRGRMYDARNEYERAFSAYERAAGQLRNPIRLAGIHMRMAVLQEAMGDRKKAAAYARRSAELSPDYPRALRDAGYFFLNRDNLDEAAAYFDRFLALKPSAEERIGVHAAMAEAYRNQGDVDGFIRSADGYGEAIRAGGRVPSRSEEARRALFQADVHALRGESEQAFLAYGRAAELVDGNRQLAEIHYRMAEHLAGSGRMPEAVERMELSVACLPGAAWKLRQAGDFYGRFGMPDRMIEYYLRALDAAATPEAEAASHAALANAYRSVGDTERFLFHAREFVRIQAGRDGDLDAENRGLVFYYQAEINAASGDPEAAYADYERAVRLLANTGRRSDVLYKMAVLLAERGDMTGAARAMERSVALYPDAPRKLRQAGDFYGRFGMHDRMLEYHHRALERSATPEESAAALASLANAYQSLGDTERFLFHARELVRIREEPGQTLGAEGEGLVHYYRAEIHAAENDPDAAYSEYERAARLTSAPGRRADILYKMARYRAERGDMAGAAGLAEEAAALPPAAPWKLRQAGDFFGGYGMRDRMIDYYLRALDASATPESRAASHAALADAYRSADDMERFLFHAREFVRIQTERGDTIGDEDRGLVHYYRAEIHAADNNPDAAYADYERAAQLISNPGRRADILRKMAAYHAERGDAAGAARYMEQSAALSPESPRGLRRTGDFYGRLGLPDRMIDSYRRALTASTTPGETAEAHAALANAYKSVGDTERFLSHAREFIRLQTERGDAASAEDLGLTHYYRAEILAAEGDPDAAHADYERAVQLISSPGRRSDILYKMAQRHAGLGDAARAVPLMEQSAALLPNAPWKHRQAAGLYAGLGLAEKAAESYDRAIALGGSPADRFASGAAVAELYSRSGDRNRYLALVIELLREFGDVAALSDEQAGLVHYYRGEVLFAEGEPERAVSEYGQALAHPLGDSRAIDLHLKIARHYADSGDEEAALRHVDQALATAPPRPGTLRRVADLFHAVKRYDLEDRYYEQALESAATFGERASILAAMAGSAKARGEEDAYLARAFDYFKLVQDNRGEASDAESGLSEFYRGELHAARGEGALAYEAFSRAVELLEGKSRLSETYLKLARHDLERGDRESAANNALLAAAMEPDKGYRASEAARVLNALNRHEDAATVLRTAIGFDPVGDGDGDNLGNDYLHKYLAETYVEGIDKREGLAINAGYIDRLVDRLYGAPAVDPGSRASRELWDARRRQTRWAMNWGSLENRLHYSRDRDGDYTLSGSAELIKNIRFPNGFRMKLSAEAGGTLRGYYTGESRSARTGEWHPWESDAYLKDTFYAVVGARASLFPNVAALNPLDFRAEYAFGIGRDRDDDFRLRLKWDRTDGFSPRLSGRFWQYAKEEIGATYSVTNDDFTADASVRRGIVYSPEWDRNLLIAPYAFVDYDYAGRDASRKWGLSAGPGLAVRKYHWEDKYHAPRAYVELNLRYRIGINDGEQDSFAASLVYKF